MQLHQQNPTQGYDAQALETTDQIRARVLRELLIQANANISKDIAPALLKQEQTLNQTIDAKEKQLVQLSSQPNKAAQLPTLNQEIATLYAQRDDLKNTIRATNPAYANLQYPKPTTLKAIQQQLDPDTLMLQYSLGEKESYLWVISNTTLKTYSLPKRADIEKTIATFRKELTARLAAPNSATQLTQQILTPAANDLGNKHLVIIPDGVLHTIPFAALNTPNSAAYKPILTQHEITNLPSASTIAILRSTVATKPRGTKTLAILADPIFGKDDPRLTGKIIQANNNLDLGEQSARGRVGRDLDLNRLPFTETEAKGILALVPNQESTSAFGFDASYDWITSPKISQYRYVHLATHGFFDNDKPALSSIILSSFDAKGNDRKAFLRFPDLFNLNLPTELVVLSACETGLGNNVPGEGLVGMTRGLMYAGALRVAVSLWAVDDQATSDLMQDFYKNLWQAKQSHAASLRAAQLKLHQQGKAPYYWAAFTLQGEWRN
jgi:CHAT domain-containing protein